MAMMNTIDSIKVVYMNLLLLTYYPKTTQKHGILSMPLIRFRVKPGEEHLIREAFFGNFLITRNLQRIAM